MAVGRLRRQHPAAAVVILFVCLCIAAPTLSWTLRNDDMVHVYWAKHRLSDGLATAFTFTYEGFEREQYGWREHGFRSTYYRPGVDLSFALDFAMFGFWDPGYRLTNILIYFLSAMLVYGITFELFNSAGAALLAGILFLGRSGNANSIVAQVAGRTDSLAGLLVLAATLAFIRYRSSESRLFLTLAVLAAACGFFTKETTLGIPAILVLYDVVYLRPFAAKRLAVHGLFFAALGFYLCVRIALLGALGAPVTQFSVSLKGAFLALLAMPDAMVPEHFGLDKQWFLPLLPFLLATVWVCARAFRADASVRRAALFVFPSFYLAAGAALLLRVPRDRFAYTGAAFLAAWFAGVLLGSQADSSTSRPWRIARWGSAGFVGFLLLLNFAAFREYTQQGGAANRIALNMMKDLGEEAGQLPAGSTLFLVTMPAACSDPGLLPMKQPIFYNGLFEWGLLHTSGKVRIRNASQFMRPCFSPFSLQVERLSDESFRVDIGAASHGGSLLVSQFDMARMRLSQPVENSFARITPERLAPIEFRGRLNRVDHAREFKSFLVSLKTLAAEKTTSGQHAILYHDSETLWKLTAGRWEPTRKRGIAALAKPSDRPSP